MVTGFMWDLEKGVHRSLLEEKWEKDFENCKKKKRKKNCLNIVSQLYFNKIYILRKKIY